MVNAEGIALLSAASAEVAVKVGMLAWTTLISIPSSTRLRVATNLPPLYSKSLVFFSFFFVFSFFIWNAAVQLSPKSRVVPHVFSGTAHVWWNLASACVA